MLAPEELVMWQREEAQLVARFESLLQSLVTACDAVQIAIDPALLASGREGTAYRAAVEAARAQLKAVTDHRKRFAEARAEADGARRAPAGAQTQSFGVLQNGSNWRELRGGKR